MIHTEFICNYLILSRLMFWCFVCEDIILDDGTSLTVCTDSPVSSAAPGGSHMAAVGTALGINVKSIFWKPGIWRWHWYRLYRYSFLEISRVETCHARCEVPVYTTPEAWNMTRLMKSIAYFNQTPTTSWLTLQEALKCLPDRFLAFQKVPGFLWQKYFDSQFNILWLHIWISSS